MAGTFWALVPPIVAIVLALITKETYSSLFIGIVVGALFLGGFAVCMILQGLVSWILLEAVGMKDLPEDVIPFLPMKNAGQNIVMLIAMVVYTLANYVWNRTVTFKDKEL